MRLIKPDIMVGLPADSYGMFEVSTVRGGIRGGACGDARGTGAAGNRR